MYVWLGGNRSFRVNGKFRPLSLPYKECRIPRKLCSQCGKRKVDAYPRTGRCDSCYQREYKRRRREDHRLMLKGIFPMCAACGKSPQEKYQRGLCRPCSRVRKEKAKGLVADGNRSLGKGIMPRVLDAVHSREIRSIYCQRFLLELPIASCDAEREQGCHCELVAETDLLRKG